MGIRKVLQLGNPDLKRISTDITEMKSELPEIMIDLKNTLEFLQETKKMGRALAAPQIGFFKKVIHFNLPDRNFYMINPGIVRTSLEKQKVWDTCYSFDTAFFVEIERFIEIELEYQTETSEIVTELFTGDMSELVQHETDHLEGILAVDHLKENSRIIMRREWEERYRQ